VISSIDQPNTIQMSSLGNNGRFGNQLFQYAFAKSYADKYNCVLEIPSDWIGRKIFKIEDNVLTNPLPMTDGDEIQFGEINIDMFGFFQHQKFLDIMDIKKVKEWFTFKEEIVDLFVKPKDFYVAAHLRHGDFVHAKQFCTITHECYVNTCLENGYNKEDIIVVSEEIMQPADLGRMDIEHKGENWDFLYDFLVLMNSNVLYRSNSTFGWWAGVLGNHEKVYSPVVQGKQGEHMICVDFVEGNHPCHMEIDNNRHTDLYLV